VRKPEREKSKEQIAGKSTQTYSKESESEQVREKAREKAGAMATATAREKGQKSEPELKSTFVPANVWGGYD